MKFVKALIPLLLLASAVVNGKYVEPKLDGIFVLGTSDVHEYAQLKSKTCDVDVYKDDDKEFSYMLDGESCYNSSDIKFVALPFPGSKNAGGYFIFFDKSSNDEDHIAYYKKTYGEPTETSDSELVWEFDNVIMFFARKDKSTPATFSALIR